jgi:hypothetical protein
VVWRRTNGTHPAIESCMTYEHPRLPLIGSSSLSIGRKRSLVLGLAMLALVATGAGCGSVADVRISGIVVVPAALTAGFSADRPGAVVLETWAEHATRPGIQWNLGVLCEPSSSDVRLAFENVVNLEQAGCPTPTTVMAELVDVPAAPPGCDGARAFAAEQPATFRPRASATVKVFEDRDGKAFCDRYADDYRAHAELTLAPER